ncbi:MAG TPA: hypothetical protein VK604_24825 [Bryobacteraceae bacterium]|nr:hypothetical protein [Bryobacteraceae bacterium]
MKREPEFFGDTELNLVFMARRLREALKIEEIFTAANIDYLVETGTYTGGMLLKRELTGAFFYVTPEAWGPASQLLLANRFKPYQQESA